MLPERKMQLILPIRPHGSHVLDMPDGKLRDNKFDRLFEFECTGIGRRHGSAGVSPA